MYFVLYKMWKSPIYEFRSSNNIPSFDYKKIIIDVTGSAPPMSAPGNQLKKVFNRLIENLSQTSKVLDLGAARLRNSKYFVDKGVQVYSADFPELFKKGSAAEKRLSQLMNKNNFYKLIFPKDLYRHEERFDLILLINVPTVMPIPIERICLILLARNLLKTKGLFLWYSDPMIRVGKNNYLDRYTRPFLDGFLPGPKKKNKENFYVELHEEEIETMIEMSGLKIKKEISEELKEYSYTNIVYCAELKDRIIFSKSLELSNLISLGTKDQEDYYTYREFPLLLELLGEELKTTIPGRKINGGEPTRFHHVIAYILKNLFKEELTDMVIEREDREGDIKIDITFRRKDESGFFKDLKEVYGIRCPYIIIECKNYSNDPGNPAYDQLDSRLRSRTGMFGILIVRKINDKDKCVKNCIDRNRDSNNEEFIIVLDDDDIHNLIKAKTQDSERLSKLLHQKMDRIMFSKKRA